MFGRIFITFIFLFLVSFFTFLYFGTKKLEINSSLKNNPKESLEVEKLKEVNVALSEENASGETGKVNIKDIDGKVRLSLEMRGYPEDTLQLARIISGKCSSPSQIKYELVTINNGRSETTLDVSWEELKSELPLSIVVYKAPTEMGSTSSCGNLFLD